MTPLALLLTAHIAGMTLWIAGLVALASLTSVGARARAPGILADAGATLTLLSGVQMALSRELFSQTWLFIKLVVVAGLIGAHIAIRVRARRGGAGGGTALLAIVLVLALIIIYVVVTKPFR